MADFSDKITIDIDLDTSGLDALTTAATQLESIDDVADGVADGLNDIEDSFDGLQSQLASSSEEIDRMVELGDALEKVAENKSKVADENEHLSDKNEKTSETTEREAFSFQELIDKADNLEGVKRAVANANKHLSDQNEETARTAIRESDAFREFKDEIDDTDGFIDSLIDSNRILQDTHDDTTKSTDRNRSAIRRMKNSLGDMSNEMRAAQKVGSLFEDGLGSLSVNIGAFTVAMRNFVTQVPLLIGSLGALASSALGVAGAFVTAGSAITAAIGGGAIAMAQGLKEEYSEIDSLGQAMQVMFAGVRDVFLESLEPLTQAAGVVGFFRDTVSGLAQATNMMAQSFAGLLHAEEDWREGTLGVIDFTNELGSRLVEPFGEAIASMEVMFRVLQDEFADIIVGLTDDFSDFVDFLTIFTDGITEAGDELDRFLSATAELALLAKTIIAGLEPVFLALIEVASDLASFLNELNPALVSGLVTFAAIALAVSKFAGAISGLLTLVPGLIIALISSEGSMNALISSFGDFASEQGQVLGGFLPLIQTIKSFNNDLRKQAIAAGLAEQGLDELDDETKQLIASTYLASESQEELREDLLSVGFAADLSSAKMRKLTATNFSSSLGAMGASAGQTAGRFGVLGGVLTKLGGALSALISPFTILAALLAGGLFVGIIGNMDAIMQVIGGVGAALESMLGFLAGQAIELFVGIWNAMHDALVGIVAPIQALMEAFSTGGEGAGFFGEAVSFLVKYVEYLVEALILAFEIVGTLIRIIGQFIAIVIKVSVAIARISRALVGVGLRMLGLEESADSLFSGIIDWIFNTIDMIFALPEAFIQALDQMSSDFQSMVNQWIDGINDVIQAFNAATGSNVELISRMEFGAMAGEGARVNAKEFREGLPGGTQPKRDPTITFEEDNSTNIDQTVNADPEDQAQLSRTVTDAIEEADSFNRRREGGQ